MIENSWTITRWRAASLRQIAWFACLVSMLPLLRYYHDGFRTVDWPLEISGFPVGRDFANIWAGGRAALAGSFDVLYSAQRHIDDLARLIHPALNASGPTLVWSYPPTAFWLGILFGGLGFTLALGLWSLLGLLACHAAATITSGPRGGAGRAITIGIACLLLAMPGVVIALLYGQTALLSSAAIVGGLVLSARRPIAAGAILATLVAKPHLGLVLPVALIALRRWPAILSTAAFSTLYLAVTLLAFGVQPWQSFFAIAVPQQMMTFLLGDFRIAEMMISPYFLGRAFGLPAESAMRVHVAVSIATVAMLYRLLPRLGNEDVRLVAVAAGVLLLSPYMQLYECAILSLVAVRLVLREDKLEPWLQTAMKPVVLALVLAPVFCLLVASVTNVNPAAVVLIALLGWLARSARQARSRVVTAGTVGTHHSAARRPKRATSPGSRVLPAGRVS